MNGTRQFPRKIVLGDWSFKTIRLRDMIMYSDYILKSECTANLWPSNFAYLWASSQSRSRKTLWKIVDGLLVTFAYTDDNALYMICLPIGEGDPDQVVDVLYRCMAYCFSWNHQNRNMTLVKTINEPQLQFLRRSKKFDDLFSTKELQGIERHYNIQSLISLQGKDFKNLRGKMNRFYRCYPDAIIRKYEPDDYNNLLLLNEKWRNNVGKKYSKIFDGVYYRQIIKHSNDLNQLVLVAEIDGEVVGMVSGGVLPRRQSWACLGKTSGNIEGLSEVLLIELVREINRINPSIELLNDGSDLGEAGLRSYKEKFRPVLNLKRYRVYMK